MSVLNGVGKCKEQDEMWEGKMDPGSAEVGDRKKRKMWNQ
jgi:hypothetical protein